MKNIFCLLMVLCWIPVFAQDEEVEIIDQKEPKVQISVYGKSIIASLLSNNDTNCITIYKNKTTNDAKMVVANPQARTDTTIIRKFMLMSEKDEEINVPFTSRIVGFTNASLKEIIEKTQKGTTYFLYTIATPKDPAIAARVRVRRILLTKIILK